MPSNCFRPSWSEPQWEPQPQPQPVPRRQHREVLTPEYTGRGTYDDWEGYRLNYTLHEHSIVQVSQHIAICAAYTEMSKKRSDLTHRGFPERQKRSHAFT